MTLEKFIKNMKNSTLTTKLLLAGVVLVVAVKANTLLQHNDISQSSVMITNSLKTNGGSGVILSSDNTGSKILTNSHVCRVIENGGLVIHKNETFRVFAYTHSKTHDLCLISVKSNLGVNTKVASSAPTAYNEKAYISGHPNLLPNVVTSGHFSDKMIIQVMTGMRPCTAAELEKLEFGCGLLGGMPIIKEYESTLVSATIMPGSSGSGVFNERFELTGLAFAGSKNLSYAWVVPFEDLTFFLQQEIRVLTETVVSSEVPLQVPNDGNSFMEKIEEACLAKESLGELGTICDIIKRDSLWRG